MKCLKIYYKNVLMQENMVKIVDSEMLEVRNSFPDTFYTFENMACSMSINNIFHQLTLVKVTFIMPCIIKIRPCALGTGVRIRECDETMTIFFVKIYFFHISETTAGYAYINNLKKNKNVT